MSALDGLPEFALQHILSFLAPEDLCRVAQASRALRASATSESLWRDVAADMCGVPGAAALAMAPGCAASWREACRAMRLAGHEGFYFLTRLRNLTFGEEGVLEVRSGQGVTGDDRCLSVHPALRRGMWVCCCLSRPGDARLSYILARPPVLYFELSVSPEPRETQRAHPLFGTVSVCYSLGLVPPRYPESGSQPGWKPCSVAYHGDDGRLFHSRGSGKRYGPKFGPGDTVGCAWCPQGQFVFFTHNGDFLKPVRVEFKAEDEMHAAVGFDGDNALRLNFGEEPFVASLPEVLSHAKQLCSTEW
eukprot:m51a1_g10733 hypothetical protein (304) ;mRNA; r:298682-299901